MGYSQHRSGQEGKATNLLLCNALLSEGYYYFTVEFHFLSTPLGPEFSCCVSIKRPIKLTSVQTRLTCTERNAMGPKIWSLYKHAFKMSLYFDMLLAEIFFKVPW